LSSEEQSQFIVDELAELMEPIAGTIYATGRNKADFNGKIDICSKTFEVNIIVRETK